MTGPIATAEAFDAKQALQAEFENRAYAAFDRCIDALNKADFYEGVNRLLNAGRSLEEEIPEAKGLAADVVKQTVERLKRQAEIAANEAWELEASLRGIFVTTVRSGLPLEERIPQYDVEHFAKMDAGECRVCIKSWRRNVEVKIVGSELALEQLWIEMSMSVLRAV